jgi:hypothetical protein
VSTVNDTVAPALVFEPASARTEKMGYLLHGRHREAAPAIAHPTFG